MDKLTEQWRNGTLEDGFYYVKENNEVFISPCSKHYLLSVLNDCEVLAPVPDYNQFSQLVKKVEQLEDAETTLKVLSAYLSDRKETSKVLQEYKKKWWGVK